MQPVRRWRILRPMHLIHPIRVLLAAVLGLTLLTAGASAQVLSQAELEVRVEPPYKLGEKLSETGIWSIVDLSGDDAGYVFETGPLAPLLGFSGAPG